MRHLAPPATSKNPMLLQTVEWACTCKDRAYLQPRFELPSALTSCFSVCFDR